MLQERLSALQSTQEGWGRWASSQRSLSLKQERLCYREAMATWRTGSQAGRGCRLESESQLGHFLAR